MTKYVDAHCHIPASIEVSAPGIYVLGGVDPADWQAQRNLKARLPTQIHCTFGIHPWTVDSHPANVLEKMWQELQSLLPDAVAVGETGLDKARCAQGLDLQLEWFRRHIALGKPLVLHIVRAHVEALSVLPASCTGLVHGFTGDFPTAKRYLDKGLHLGIGPRYKRSKHFADLARLPLEQIVLESDAPIGSTNIGDVARELTASDASAGELLVRATANAKRLFGIT